MRKFHVYGLKLDVLLLFDHDIFIHFCGCYGGHEAKANKKLNIVAKIFAFNVEI